MKKIIAGMLMLGIVFLNIHAQSIQEQLTGKINKVVALDGSGDYTSISAAINAAPNNSTTRYVIFVKNGTYIEKVEVPSSKTNIALIGESVDSTIISYNDYSGSGVIYNGIISSSVGNAIGTSTSHTLYIDAADFILINLTVINTAGPVGQAVAVNLGDDRIIIVHCRIIGNQDTFYTWGYGRFYIKESYIEGNVDFIFGRGTALFDSCLINTNRSGSDITAASTDENWKFGYVFDRCRLIANHGVTSVSMGRPWKTYAQTVFMNTRQEAHIKAAGWSDWDGRSATCYYAEYNNNGPGSSTTSRVSWSHQLTDTEAQNYTIQKIFAKDVNPSNFSSDWLPLVESDELVQVIRQNTEKLIYDTLFNIAYLKSLQYNQQDIEGFTAKTTVYNVGLPEGTTDIPLIEAIPESEKATVVITNPSSLPGSATIAVTAQNGLKLTYTINYSLVVNIKNIFTNNSAKVMVTNPFYENLEVKSEYISDKELTFILFNTAGQQMICERIKKIEGDQFTIPAFDIKPGIYFYRIEFNNQALSGKLVKFVK